MFVMPSQGAQVGRPRGGDAAVLARIRRAPGLSPSQYCALAGFFDAEGYFAISTTGKTPRCSASISLRDDDAQVVYEFRQATGLGHVTAVPARGRSKPQVRWEIGTKHECRSLAAVFERYPLLGRKRFEAAVWSEAVKRWCGPAGHDRSRALEVANHELRRLREYNPEFERATPVVTSRPHLLAHFGGFFSGDGSLSLDPGRRRAQVIVRLRRDDTPLLRLFQTQLGVGRVIPVAAGTGQKPVVLWHVTARPELGKAIAILDRTLLLGLKKLQYGAWRPAAAELVEASVEKRRPDPEVLDGARSLLTEIRRYKQPASCYTTVRFEGGNSYRAVYTEILRAWSDEQPGCLSCTAYTNARRANHPEWPTRGTLVANFGSWLGALEAAGIAHRASSRSGLTSPTE